MITFNEYLSLNIEEADKIIDFYIHYLTELSSKDFPYEEQLKLTGTAEKFLNAVAILVYLKEEKRANYLNQVSELKTLLHLYSFKKDRSYLSKILFPTNRRLLNNIRDIYGVIYSETLGFINETSKVVHFNDSLKLNGFYQPENSNKEKIQRLIAEAIVLINEDDNLTTEAKKQLVSYLERVIKDIDRKFVNWSGIIGKIKETVIVLGAMGSLVGGGTALLAAKEKLEESTTVIQKTSINFNHKILNETFEVQHIEHSKIFGFSALQIEAPIDPD